MNKSPWILKSVTADSALILFPGVIVLCLLISASKIAPAMSVFLISLMVLVDSAHVFSTSWRTLFRVSEYKREWSYWGVPLICFGVSFAWLTLGIPYYLAFLVYATVFHYMRQNYGIIRWYERLSGKARKLSEWHFYLLVILPIVTFHFSSLDSFGMFSDSDIPLHADERVYFVGLFLSFAALFAWCLREFAAIRRGDIVWSASLSIFGTVLPFYALELFPKHNSIILPILLASHGIPYFAVFVLSMKRVGPLKQYGWPLLAMLVVGSSFALAIVSQEIDLRYVSLTEDVFHGMSSTYAFLLAAVFTPVLSHYFWDAIIWRGSREEARVVVLGGELI